MQSNKSINGLVLAGGRSERMGYDKSSIKWHGIEQKYFLADLLKSYCKEVFIARRSGQETENNNSYKILEDAYPGSGPLGAILTALQFSTATAWLVVACDLPLLDERTIEYLIANRDRSAMATAFESPYDRLPEPLITIWEPQSIEPIISKINEGMTCPRKALINSKVAILQPPYRDALHNANTPEDVKMINYKYIATFS